MREVLEWLGLVDPPVTPIPPRREVPPSERAQAYAKKYRSIHRRIDARLNMDAQQRRELRGRDGP